MIISRTPFRVSFLGGGTDLPEFYQEEEGAVLSTTIDKYIYITVNNRFDASYRLSYSKTEICQSPREIEHPIFRHVLAHYGELAGQMNGGRGLELLSMADIPSGTGLGSSSSFTVGLLHALKGHVGRYQSASDLASEASRIEIEDLREPIGKQDQYAAAFGGLNFIRFLPSGEVSVEPVICQPQKRAELEGHILLLYTGMTRPASAVLSEQRQKTGIHREALRTMRVLAERMRELLQTQGSMSQIGELLHEGWTVKKSLASGVSASQIDQWYDIGRGAGAYGGKILGAGGGGFLMFLVPPDKRERVRMALSDLRELPVRMEPFGSRIIFVD